MASENPQKPTFTTTLTEKDWDLDLGGWRCPALKIPGAEVANIYRSGDLASGDEYKIDNEYIRSVRPPKPPQIVVSICLTLELSTQKLTLKWQKLAIILPIIATLGTALIAGLISIYMPHNPCVPVTKNREPIILSVGGPIFGDCGEVRVPGSATRANGSQDNISISWNWGDGIEDNQYFTAIHRYSRNGSYSVKLTVKSDTDQSESRAVNVNVINAGQAKCK